MHAKETVGTEGEYNSWPAVASRPYEFMQLCDRSGSSSHLKDRKVLRLDSRAPDLSLKHPAVIAPCKRRASGVAVIRKQPTQNSKLEIITSVAAGLA